MKIYFAASIRAGREDASLYHELIEYLKKYGEVLTEHVGDKELSVMGEKNITEEEIHDRDMKWVLKSDVIVAEVTTPSLGVGYEIGRAVEHKKKILCLYRPQKDRKLSGMLLGSKKIVVKKYHYFEEAKQKIDEFFE